MADPRELLRRLENPSYGQAADAKNAIRALEVLEALGDLRPAEAETLAQLRQSRGEIDKATGGTEAAYRGALHGATFRYSDELGLQDGNVLDTARQNFPTEFGRGETAGAVGTGLAIGAATAPFAPAGLGGQVLFGGALGAGEGALYASGDAPPGERLSAAGRGALIGGSLGLAAPAVVAGAGRAIGAVGDAAAGAVGIGNQGRASRAVAADMRASGQTAGDVSDAVSRAALQGQPGFRAMDAMGAAGMRRASGVVRSGGPGAEELTEFLSRRQAEQGDRVAGFVDDAFGTSGTTAERTRARLTEDRATVANAMYDAARAGASPVNIRPAVAIIDRRIRGMQGSNIRGDGIDAKLAGFRSRLIADPPPAGTTSVELSDFDRVLGVKQDVQDAIGAAIRAGRNNEARELGKLSRELDRALEQASDAYRFANDNYREASRVIDALSEGADMASRGRGLDNADRVAQMTPDQQRAAAVGYGDARLGQLERNASPTADKSKPLRTEKAQAEANALALDPQLLAERLERERIMWATQNRALGGSRTADNQADIADNSMLADAARAGQDLAVGNTGTAISRGTEHMARVLSGQNAATRKIIADILMSPDPREALTVVLRSERSASRRSFIAQSVVRSLGRPAMTENRQSGPQ